MTFRKEKVNKVLDKLIRLIYPKHCPVCDKIIPIQYDYCICSRMESRRVGGEYCRHCGHNSNNCVCFAHNSVYLPDITAPYIYGGKVRADILNLKFNNDKYLAVKLGTDMAERVAFAYSDVDFDLVAFVPMSERSKNIRTYNQSELLARQVAKLMFLPVEDLFIKTRETQTQHTLGGAERRKNLSKSVEVRNPASVKGKTILLCDDIKTTGSTLNQCVIALNKAGAKRVCCVCVALSDFSAK